MRHGFARLLPRVAAFAVSGCVPQLGVPPGAEIACSADHHCPPTMICIDALCIDPEQLLGDPCETGADCDDGAYCNGAEQCTAGHCRGGDPPCVAAFPCVINTCDEAVDACSISVDHGACAAGSYCEPSLGCLPGQGCSQDSDCLDSSLCNGLERCLQ